METQLCTSCGSTMRLISAGVSKKTGKSYNSFYVCPKNCKQEKKTQKSDEYVEMMNFIAEEFANLNKRFDLMATYLKKHLEKNAPY